MLRVAFGEWPDPVCNHPDSTGINEFVRSLEAEGYAPLISDGRRAVAEWFDPKPSLRRLRLMAGLSQEQLAERMGTSQAQIARMESGRQDLQISTVRRLAEALGVNVYAVVDATA